MTDRKTIRVKSPEQWAALTNDLAKWDFEKFPRRITIEPDSGEDVQDCFAVFWIFMRQLSDHFRALGRDESPEDFHDLMCLKFFGMAPEHLVGKTLIPTALITLTYPHRKTKDRMCVLLSQIEEWAMDHGCYLVTQKLNEYQKWKEAQA